MHTSFYRHELTQGEDYNVDIDLQDGSTLIDTTGWTGASAIVDLDHVAPLDGGSVPIAFAVSFPASGTVRLTLPAALNRQLEPQRYLSDTKLSDSSGRPAYFLSGEVIVRRSYTP